MKLGKLTTKELEDNVLSRLHKIRPEVLMGAALGEDCAALDIDDLVLISSDPITAVVELQKLGALCVSVCCNDIAANGGIPVAVTLTLIMPPSSTAEDVGVVMDGAIKCARSLSVDIVGGHTEFSDCVTRPIVCGTAVGRVKRLIRKTDLAVGDRLFVTKKLALEGTCILADLVKPKLDDGEREKLDRFNASLDVNRESKILAAIPEVTVMHDVTEGGILGAVAEICLSRGLGARLFAAKMPIDTLTKRLCAERGIDPLRLISSGSMLAAVRGDTSEAVLQMKNAGIEFTEIGYVTEGEVLLEDIDGNNTRVEITKDEMYGFTGEDK